LEGIECGEGGSWVDDCYHDGGGGGEWGDTLLLKKFFYVHM
jgi:hypothetical protein